MYAFIRSLHSRPPTQQLTRFFRPRQQQIASHGLFDIEVKAKGDIWIDDHHTTEDIALAFGQCLSQALGNRYFQNFCRRTAILHAFSFVDICCAQNFFTGAG